jgi:tight adherence protein B
MNWMPWLNALITFVGFSLLVYFVQQGSRILMTREVRQRLYQTVNEAVALEAPSAPEPPSRRDLLPTLTEYLRQQPFGRKLQDYLRSAGWKLRASEFLYLSALMGVACAALAVLVSGSRLVAPLGLIVGGILPFFLAHQSRTRRLAKLDTQLRDWLLLTASCMRAGHSWSSALNMAARDLDPPLSEELNHLLAETQRGVSWEEGFKNLLRRAPSEDLELIVIAILIQREVGGNLGEILTKILHTIQERVRIRGEVKILSAQGILSGVVVGLLPAGLGAVLMLLQPDYFKPLLTSPVGRGLLMGGFLLQVLGGLAIKKLVTIEY